MSTSNIPATIPAYLSGTALGPRVISRSVVMADGYSAEDVQRKRRKREWVSLRPGAYLDANECRALSPEQRHILLIDATMPKISQDAVLSHQSAACLLGITLWPTDLRAVRITVPGAASGHRRPSLHTHRASLEDDEIIVVGGRRLTSPARTLVDLSRSLSFESAVVSADAALHLNLCTPEDLISAAARAPRRPGMRNARHVANFADGRSESPGESRSRALFRDTGIPMPEPQFRLLDQAGMEFARSDFCWEQFRTIGEFDGAQKYGRLLRPGQTAGDQVYREKLREDEIRRLGWKVVRWSWPELENRTRLTSKIIDMLYRDLRPM